MAANTIRLTMAQAVIRYLCNQFTEIEGERVPLFAGVFGIFGHGNVTCLAEALAAAIDDRHLLCGARSHQYGHCGRRGPFQPPTGAAAFG